MSGRLLDWPSDLFVGTMQPLSGPRAVGAVSNESMTGFVQTVASAFGARRWQFTIPYLQGQALRRLRGLITALNGGANAVRIEYHDPDNDELTVSRVSWDNGQLWDNGQSWQSGTPIVSVAAAAAILTDTITLADEYWASDLDVGDWIGFVPFHFGVYEITETFDFQPLTYRIWPPLRAALTTDDFATLAPTMVMRLESENGASWSRDAQGARDISVTLIEVEDADVRDYFSD